MTFTFTPTNIVLFLSFFSPIILTSCIVGISVLFQHAKGFVYMGFLLGCCFIRKLIYSLAGSSPFQNDNTLCSSIQYTTYGNQSFSVFVFAFTIMYLSIPMFSNHSVNYPLFISMLLYFCVDVFVKMYSGCIKVRSDYILNIILGACASTLIVSLMVMGGSAKYLFFNEVSLNKDVCYQPSKQTFKCNVYKGGTLIQ